MIIGQINANREAEIRLPIQGTSEQQIEVEAVIDTGFTDYLTLPPDLIDFLQLTFRESSEFLLADGNAV
ncbi:MAG: hypothetical protein M3Y13_12820 [Armatimonadota bacterium]|nr:hypothetical protein [Armatimonadota bacterium]